MTHAGTRAAARPGPWSPSLESVMTADPHAFESAESQYARFRPQYPDELYALLAD
ncbi:hypothetical protein ABZY06_34945 [Streptomyces sp. NPDC006540]|uniref:hypothetical protein n=1 Tax=Streptomyces sp. NPDC006540 TaxID=3155353 RepID=UPI0033A04626